MYPLEPAWKTFQVKPQMGHLEYVETGNETVAGMVSVTIRKRKKGMDMEVVVPQGSEAIVYFPAEYKNVSIDNVLASPEGNEDDYTLFRLKGGSHKLSSN
ncbi:MAG: hypothetical protein KAJ23_01535 [Maribacter sp.]|nr:hypothetical protein [Maribacter sp.]